MKEIELFRYSSDFAENKDIARKLRLEQIDPVLKNGIDIIIDFQGVTSATQSFIHALLSQTIREFGVTILDRINFKNCNEQIQTVIEIVVEYVQDGIFIEDE